MTVDPEEPAAPQEHKKSFFTTLPGLATALAGLITAVATLVGVLSVSGGDDNGGGGNQNGGETPTLAEWARDTNEQCEEFKDDFRNVALNIVTPEDYLNAWPRVAPYAKETVGKIRLLPRPEEERERIDTFLTTWSTWTATLDSSYQKYLAQDQGYLNDYNLGRDYQLQIQTIALDLGAEDCDLFRF